MLTKFMHHIKFQNQRLLLNLFAAHHIPVSQVYCHLLTLKSIQFPPLPLVPQVLLGPDLVSKMFLRTTNVVRTTHLGIEGNALIDLCRYF